jgi:glutamate dehydrogenase/leucine dehydrogenase
MSDSSGYIYDEQGIDSEKLKFIMMLKNVKRGRIEEYGTPGNSVNGANIAGFVKVADAMMDQGIV